MVEWQQLINFPIVIVAIWFTSLIICMRNLTYVEILTRRELERERNEKHTQNINRLKLKRLSSVLGAAYYCFDFIKQIDGQFYLLSYGDCCNRRTLIHTHAKCTTHQQIQNHKWKWCNGLILADVKTGFSSPSRRSHCVVHKRNAIIERNECVYGNNQQTFSSKGK